MNLAGRISQTYARPGGAYPPIILHSSTEERLAINQADAGSIPVAKAIYDMAPNATKGNVQRLKNRHQVNRKTNIKTSGRQDASIVKIHGKRLRGWRNCPVIPAWLSGQILLIRKNESGFLLGLGAGGVPPFPAGPAFV